LFVFVIDVVFKSGKQWGSFDAGERGFIDDGDVEWGLWLIVAVQCEDCDEDCDYDRNPLLEDCDYDRSPFIN